MVEIILLRRVVDNIIVICKLGVVFIWKYYIVFDLFIRMD